MQIVWSEKKTKELLLDFHNISGFRIGLFDIDGREVIAYPQELNCYCNYIRKFPKGKQECLRCDNAAYRHAMKKREFDVYTCHAGLTEMIAPIMEQDNILGFLMIGQIRTEGISINRKEIYDRLTRLNIDTAPLPSLFEKVPIYTTEKLMAYSKILKACAVYTYYDKFIRMQNEPLAVRVERYIVNNIEKPMCIDGLCAEFGIGKTTLCKAIKKTFFLTVSELIRSRRIEKAMNLLQTNDDNIMAIAAAVGIDDYNYFTKIFKNQVGITPSTYRKMCKEECSIISK